MLLLRVKRSYPLGGGRGWGGEGEGEGEDEGSANAEVNDVGIAVQSVGTIGGGLD